MRRHPVILVVDAMIGQDNTAKSIYNSNEAFTALNRMAFSISGDALAGGALYSAKNRANRSKFSVLLLRN